MSLQGQGDGDEDRPGEALLETGCGRPAGAALLAAPGAAEGRGGANLDLWPPGLWGQPSAGHHVARDALEHLPRAPPRPPCGLPASGLAPGRKMPARPWGGGRSQAQPGSPGLTHCLGMAPQSPDPGSLPARRTLVPGGGGGAPTPLARPSALPVSVRRPPPMTDESPGL